MRDMSQGSSQDPGTRRQAHARRLVSVLRRLQPGQEIELQEPPYIIWVSIYDIYIYIYYTIVYYTILYYTILYYDILVCTIIIIIVIIIMIGFGKSARRRASAFRALRPAGWRVSSY